MSRIGKKPIIIPSNVDLVIDGCNIKVKGPKGQLIFNVNPKALIERDGHDLVVKVAQEEDKFERSLWGTTRNIIANMIEGVTNGFIRKLEINGVGYNASVAGNNINLNVGYSHPVVFNLPDGITAHMEKNVILLAGADKQLIGEVAARIRQIRKPEPYKGKGIKYSEETIRRKAGKASKK